MTVLDEFLKEIGNPREVLDPDAKRAVIALVEKEIRAYGDEDLSKELARAKRQLQQAIPVLERIL